MKFALLSSSELVEINRALDLQRHTLIVVKLSVGVIKIGLLEHAYC